MFSSMLYAVPSGSTSIELHGKVGVFGVARHVERDVDGAADLQAFLERAGAVDEDVVARFQGALVDGAGLISRRPCSRILRRGWGRDSWDRRQICRQRPSAPAREAERHLR